MPVILPLPRLATTGLLFLAGSLAAVDVVAIVDPPLLLAQRTVVDGVDDVQTSIGGDWAADGTEARGLGGANAGPDGKGVIGGGRRGGQAIRDSLPALPAVLPVVPVSLPKRPGAEPQADGGALAPTLQPRPIGDGPAPDLRQKMREYGTRISDGDHERAADVHRPAPGAMREGRWLDADERSSFREALRERHHRPRH